MYAKWRLLPKGRKLDPYKTETKSQNKVINKEGVPQSLYGKILQKLHLQLLQVTEIREIVQKPMKYDRNSTSTSVERK